MLKRDPQKLYVITKACQSQKKQGWAELTLNYEAPYYSESPRLETPESVFIEFWKSVKSRTAKFKAFAKIWQKKAKSLEIFQNLP